MRLASVVASAVLLLLPAPGRGDERALTLLEALALARERGGALALARGRVAEARARQERAGRRLQEDPVLEASGGQRRGEEDFFDWEVAVSQDLEAGKRRAARVAGARAGLERAEAELAEAERRLLADVAAAFHRALAARDRRALLGRGRETAERLLAATERGYEGGETTALEHNRARTAAATARAEERAAEADLAAGLAGLEALLGLGPGELAAVRGDLAAIPAVDLEALLGALARRPDLQALAAELREAEAEVLLGRALSRPDLGVRGGVERDEGDDVVTAGVALSLPVAGRAREAVAVGQARVDALRQALAAARRAAEAEVRGGAAALARRLEAAREIERTALPALGDNESLSWKSFEAGEISLGELLLVRREILETRLIYLDRLLEAALARAELQAAAGAQP